MSKVLVFGHKNPDTDTICSAIVMAEMQKKMGVEAKAVRLGKINKETMFALNYFNAEIPELIEKVEENQEVILVDHNEFQQSVDGIEKAKITTVVDHHRIDNFSTSEPLFYHAEPLGCTATILYRIGKMNQMEFEPKLAGLMLSAIISDTLLFKSPTCTEVDKKVAHELAEISNIDINKYGLEMLKAGTDLGDLSEEQLINLDAKTIEKNGTKIIIAQVNTVSIEDVFKRQNKLEEAIQKVIEKDNLALFVLAVTDILNSNSELLVLGEKTEIIEKSYKLENNRAFLKGVVSRKKQILPMIDKNLD
ncbi:MAG: manganese-dependent inorganic pyrophosphatase [Clostridia bacterium]|nr:manganese-dependent inorganic pyrophosphatase [Clostridia bacterium]